MSAQDGDRGGDNTREWSHWTPIFGRHVHDNLSGRRVAVFSPEAASCAGHAPTDAILAGLGHTPVGEIVLVCPADRPSLGAEAAAAGKKLGVVVAPSVAASVLEVDVAAFDLVVLVQGDHKSGLVLSEKCRGQPNGVPFLWASQRGSLISLFGQAPSSGQCEVNPQRFCRSDAQTVHVAHVTQGSPPLVTCLLPHSLESGDVVSIGDLNYTVALVSKTEFRAHLSPTVSAAATPSRGGVSLGECVGRAVHLVSRAEDADTGDQEPQDLSQALWRPRFEDGEYGQDLLEKHVAFLAANADGMSVEAVVEQLQGSEACNVDITLAKDLASRIGEARPSATSCLGSDVLAGLVSSQGVNMLERRFRPLNNRWLHVDLGPSCDNLSSDTRPRHILLSGQGSLSARILRLLLRQDASQSAPIGRVTLAGGGGGGGDSKDAPALTQELTANERGVLLQQNDANEQQQQLGKNVSELLKDFAERTSSSVAVEIMPELSAENEAQFSEDFFQSVDLIVSTEGSWDQRRHIGELGVKHSKPFLDVGIEHFAGHIQTVIPHLTESHACSRDPLDPEYPYCAVKSFPSTPDHAVEWARNKINRIAREKPDRFNQFWKEEDLLERVKNGVFPQHSVLVRKFLSQQICVSWAECVAAARNQFERSFNHSARQLLLKFPDDDNDDDDSAASFWTFPKRAPSPLEFDLADDVHFRLVRDLSVVWAKMFRIHVSAQDLSHTSISRVLQATSVVSFQPKLNKSVVTDESVTASDLQNNAESSNNDLDAERFARQLEMATCKNLDVVSVPTETLDSLVLSMSELRCRMYSIPTPDRITLKTMAQKACPCPKPMVDVLADLTALECHKILGSCLADPSLPFRNWWLSLLPRPQLISSDPVGVAKTRATDGSRQFSLWDRLEVRLDRQQSQEWTLQRFLDHLKSHFGITVTAIVQGNRMVYIKALPNHAIRINKKLATLVKKDPSRSFISLDINILSDVAGDDDKSAPPVKLYLM